MKAEAVMLQRHIPSVESFNNYFSRLAPLVIPDGRGGEIFKES
jgi:hypothetical protein